MENILKQRKALYGNKSANPELCTLPPVSVPRAGVGGPQGEGGPGSERATGF